jgi:hypothetical protein
VKKNESPFSEKKNIIAVIRNPDERERYGFTPSTRSRYPKMREIPKEIRE